MSKESLDMADQQLTGFAHAQSGFDAVSLVESMGLTKGEWIELKKEGRTRICHVEEWLVDRFFVISD